METITSLLEISLQNCSLNHHQQRRVEREGSSPSTSGIDPPENLAGVDNSGQDDVTLELNSHVSLPYHWEQCLDLKTGEIYYINWRDGTRATADPRLSASPEYSGGDFYYSSDESSYDSDESSSDSGDGSSDHSRAVLVVAGCKSCLMYHMVPKPVGDCPKCSGQLLHFDKSDNRDGKQHYIQ